MKYLVFLLSFLPFSCIVNSQSLAEAKTLFYYENWDNAKANFEKMQEPEAVYWLIQVLLQQNDSATAASTLANAKAKFPGNPFIQAAAGHLLLAAGNKPEAQTAFEIAIANAGTNKAAILNAVGRAHGNVSLKNSEPDYGIAKLKEALTLQPGNAFIYINMGDCYRKKLDAGKAMAAYTDALNTDPRIAALANYKIGRIFAIQQNCEALTRYYNESVKADAGFIPAWRELYENYSDRENKCLDFEKAKGYFEKYITALGPGEKAELLKTAFTYSSGDYVTALKTAKELITAMGSKAPARLYKLVAYCYYEQKEYSNSVTWMEQYFIKENNTENIATHNFRILAQSYEALGQMDKARQTWVKAGEFEADILRKLTFYTLAAEAAVKMKDHTTAAAIYKFIQDKKPNPTAADFFKTGTTYYNAGNYTASSEVFKKYSEKFPADWRGPAWQARNAAIADSAMVSWAAVPYYEKTIQLSAGDPAANKIQVEACKYLFAYEYNSKKNKNAAEAYLDKILLIDPSNADAKKYKEMINRTGN